MVFRFGLLTALALCLLTPLAARADDDGSEEVDLPRARARSLELRALEAFNAGKYPLALDLFTQAEALYHAPTLLLGIARTHAKLGQLVAAADTYEQLTRTPLEPDAPEVFREAFEDGKRELTALLPRVPKLTVTVRGPSSALVRVNGVELARSAIGATRRVDPGRFRVSGSAPGFDSDELVADLAEGEQRALELVFRKRARAEAGDVMGRDARVEATTGGVQRGLGWAFVGVGLAGLATGGVFGTLALTQRSSTVDACNRGAPDCADRDRDWQLFGNVSTGAFAVGGALVLTGVVVLLTAPRAPAAAFFEPMKGSRSASGRPCTLGGFDAPQLGYCGRF